MLSLPDDIMQRDKLHSELEQCKGDLAALNISLTGTDRQLKQALKERDKSNSELKQTKVISVKLFARGNPVSAEGCGVIATDLCSNRCHGGVAETAGV